MKTMNNLDRPNDLRTIEEVIQYIELKLNGRGDRTDEQVASSIVGLESNPRLDGWYQNDADLQAIIDDSWDLEWSNGTPQELAQMWEHIEFHLGRLKHRYLHK